MSVEYIGHNVTDLKKLVYEKPVEDGLYTRFVKEQQKKHKEALRIKQKHQNETLKQKEQVFVRVNLNLNTFKFQV